MDIIIRYILWNDRKPLGAILTYTNKIIGKDKIENKLIEAIAFNSENNREEIINNYKRDCNIISVQEVKA